MMSFLEMSVMGGIMALVITVLRAVFLNKLPKKTFVFLWEVAMLRLLLPLSIPAITSVYTLFAKPQTAPLNSPEITVINAPTVMNAVPTGAFQAVTEPLQENVYSAVSVWTIVWLAGTVIVFSIFVLGYILIFRKYRYATIVKDCYPAEWLTKQKLIRKVRIYRSEQTLSPLTYGIFRPVILLPQNTDTERSEQLDFILTHELTHIKRFDMLRKIIAAAVLCLHWFNPAVWVLFLLYNRDIELACDEAVVRKTGGDCRSAYAMALIGMEERQRGFSSLFSHFSKNAVEERIVAIMKTKKLGVFTSVAACMLAVGVTCSFATSAAADKKSSKTDNDASVVDAITISNGEKYYSFDNGKTFLKQEDVDIHIPDVEWWTYDEYKAWLDKEKVELQGMLGEKGWTGGRGDFVWTQEIIDETIAMYEDILEQIKNGVKVSKSVDGDTGTMLMHSFPASSISEFSSDDISESSSNDKVVYYDKNKTGIVEHSTTQYATNENGQNFGIGKYVIYIEDLPNLIAVIGDNGKRGYIYSNELIGKSPASPEEAVKIQEAIDNGDYIPKVYNVYEADGKTIIDTFTESSTETMYMQSLPSGQITEMSIEGNDVVETVTDSFSVQSSSDDIIETTECFATESGKVDEDTIKEYFLQYSKYGVEYRKGEDGKLGNIYFNGELVKKFYDVTETSAFSMESTDGGKIIVSTVYDDNGDLIGVKQVPLMHEDELRN